MWQLWEIVGKGYVTIFLVFCFDFSYVVLGGSKTLLDFQYGPFLFNEETNVGFTCGSNKAS